MSNEQTLLLWSSGEVSGVACSWAQTVSLHSGSSFADESIGFFLPFMSPIKSVTSSLLHKSC